MFVNTPGSQAVSGSLVSGATPLQVQDADRPTRCVYTAVFNNLVLANAVWTQLIAAATIPAIATEMEVFMAGADDIQIGFGAAASENDEFQIVPGGNGRIPIRTAALTRVAAINNEAAPVTVSKLVLNFYGPA